MKEEQIKENININDKIFNPSCGDGLELVKELDIKIKIINELPEEQREKQFLNALASLYGVDIQADNVIKSRENILNFIKYGDIPENKDEQFTKLNLDISNIESAIENILETNIQFGDIFKNKKFGIKIYKRTGKVARDNKEEPLTYTDFQFDDTDNVKVTEFFAEDLECVAKEFKPISYRDLHKRKEINTIDLEDW